MQQVLQRVHDNGYTHKGIYEGWYCPRCADFKVENEILEGNRCPIHEIVLERHQEENWFFRLSAFQEPLERLFDGQPDFVMPPAPLQRGAVVHRARAPGHLAVAQAAEVGRDRALGPPSTCSTCGSTRSSTTTRRSGTRGRGRTLTGRFWPATYHLIGKDILKFHTIFWPAMLMAADLPVPNHVFVHGFLLGADGRKMSKSLGNVLDPFEVIDGYGTDALRFYLMRDVSFGGDGSVGIDAVRARYESELANEYGNLASRTIAMLLRYRDGSIPAVATDPEVVAAFEGLSADVATLLDRLEVDPGARADLAARAAAEPVRRGARALAARARSGVRPAHSTRRSRRWPRECGSSACCCTRTSRRARRGCSRRSALRGSTTRARRLHPRVSGGSVSALEPLFPKRA